MVEKPSEEALERTLVRAAHGDGDAWRSIVSLYSRRVYALIVRQCGDRELGEEITQATFVKLVANIGRYHERGKFESWLFRIAMNQLRDEMRRRKRHARPMDMSGSGRSDEESSAWAGIEARVVQQRSGAGSGEMGGSVEGSGNTRGAGGAGGSGGDGDGPFERVSRGEQIELMRQAVAKLSPADQEILVLRHTAGLSFAQIADTLGEPLGTVLARGHRVLAKLRKLMEEPDRKNG